MAHVLLDAPVRWWRCPSCLTTDRTQRAEIHTQFHACPALGNANIPLVEVASPDDTPDGRQVIIASEVGPEAASIRTDHGDGTNDITVFAQTARAVINS